MVAVALINQLEITAGHINSDNGKDNRIHRAIGGDINVESGGSSDSRKSSRAIGFGVNDDCDANINKAFSSGEGGGAKGGVRDETDKFRRFMTVWPPPLAFPSAQSGAVQVAPAAGAAAASGSAAGAAAAPATPVLASGPTPAFPSSAAAEPDRGPAPVAPRPVAPRMDLCAGPHLPNHTRQTVEYVPPPPLSPPQQPRPPPISLGPPPMSPGPPVSPQPPPPLLRGNVNRWSVDTSAGGFGPGVSPSVRSSVTRRGDCTSAERSGFYLSPSSGGNGQDLSPIHRCENHEGRELNVQNASGTCYDSGNTCLVKIRLITQDPQLTNRSTSLEHCFTVFFVYT